MRTRYRKAMDKALDNATRLAREYTCEQVARGEKLDGDSLADLVGAGLVTVRIHDRDDRGRKLDRAAWRTIVELTDAGAALIS